MTIKGKKIRTYTLAPHESVKDHRTGVEVSDAQEVLDGNLDEFIRAFWDYAGSSVWSDFYGGPQLRATKYGSQRPTPPKKPLKNAGSKQQNPDSGSGFGQPN